MDKEKGRKIYDKRLGERLGKYLKDHGETQDGLLDAASKEPDYNEKLTQGNLSGIINGNGRYLSENAADVFSRVLGIRPGYLKGDDDYRAANYEDYLIGYVKQDQLQQDFHKYDGILSMAGAKMRLIYDDDYNLIQYQVLKDGQISEFTPKDMDRHMKSYYEDLCEFAKKRLGPIMDLGTSKPLPFNVNVEHGVITDKDREEGR